MQVYFFVFVFYYNHYQNNESLSKKLKSSQIFSSQKEISDAVIEKG